MKIFALITLAVIIIVIQHLINWALRSIWEDDDDNNIRITFCVVVVSLIITIACFMWFGIWYQ